TTQSQQFPLKNPLQTTFQAQSSTGFLARLSGDSRTILFSTYIGGSGYSDHEGRVQVNSDDSFYVFGDSASPDFPVKNALQSNLLGYQDCTVVKLSAQNQVIFSTFFGSDGIDQCTGLVAKDGSLVIAGTTSSADFPLVNAIQTQAVPGPFWTTYLA